MKVKKLSTIHLRDPQKPYQDGYNESIDSVWDIPEKTAQMDNFPLGPNPPDPHGKLFTPELSSLKTARELKRGSLKMRRSVRETPVVKVADILPIMSPHNHPSKPDHGAYPHRAEEEDHEAGMTLHTPPSMRPSRKENLITLGDPQITSDPDISGDTDVKHDPDMVMSFLSQNHRAMSSPDMQAKMREYRDLRQEVQKVEQKVRSQGGPNDIPLNLEVKKSDKYKKLLGKLSELEAELQGYGMQRYQLQKLATTVLPNEDDENPENVLQRKTMNF